LAYFWQSLTAFMIWKKQLLLAISATFLLAGAILAPAAPVVQLHFVGMSMLSSNTNAAKLNTIWKFPETIQFREKVIQRMATLSGQFFPAITKAKEPLIQPLLADLLEHESVVELTQGKDQKLSLNIAVKMDEKRADFWSSNLTAIASVKPDKRSAWTVKAGDALVNFSRKQNWTRVTIGSPVESESFLARFNKKEFELKANNWLEGEVDWVRLEQSIGTKTPFKTIRSKITVSGKADDLFTTVVSQFPEKIELKSEPFRVPSIIGSPIVSFTAAQPLAAFCRPSPLLEQVGLNPLAHQFLLWSESDAPFQTFGAIPVENATNQMKAIGPKTVATFNPVLARRQSGALAWNEAKSSLSWTNVPMMRPYLHPLIDPAGQFISGGIFPGLPRTTPPPGELIKQITNKPKLVYYDWEITQNRIGHWEMMTASLPVFSPEKISDPSRPIRVTRHSHQSGRLWLKKVAPSLGNTVTEATVTGPTEVTLKRKSHLGFTGMELVYLAGLIDESGSPLLIPGSKSAPTPK
jgi:hypothetical protein